MDRIANWSKKKFITLTLIFVVVILVLAMCISLPSTYDRVITAAKLDDNGSELSTVQICITVTQYRSVFSSQLKGFVIHAFDDIIQTSTLNFSQFTVDLLTGYYMYTFAVGRLDLDIAALKDTPLSDLVTTSSYSCTVILHNDLNHLLIKIQHSDSQAVYYACSMNESTANSHTILNEMLDQTLASRTSNSSTLNWQLHGTVISDGEIQETFEFTIQGKLSSVTPPYSADDRATLTISMPDTFLYTYASDITFASFAWLEFDYPAYSGYGAFEKNAYSSTACAIAFSPDREYVIFDWRDGKRDYYLVASTNPETDPMEVYDFFRLFRETTDLGDSAPVDIPT